MSTRKVFRCVSVIILNGGEMGRDMKNIPLYKVDAISDLKQMLENSRQKYSEKNAFLRKLQDDPAYHPVTYQQYADDVEAFACRMIEMGCSGERIALIGENRYEWSVSYLSIVNAVGIVVPLDRELPVNEIITSLRRAECTAVIFSPKLEEKMMACYEQLPLVRHWITMGGTTELPQAQLFWNLIEQGRTLVAEGCVHYRTAEIDRDAMRILLFTSGTMDISKAVMLSHRNICENLMAMSSMVYIGDDVFLSILPIHHTYECTCGFLCPIYRGCTVAYCEGLRHITKNMEEAKVTMMLGVPLVFESMYKKVWDTIEKGGLTKKVKMGMKLSNFLLAFGVDKRRKLFAKVHESFGGHVRLFISGAAGIDPQVSKGFRSLGILLIQGYGLTECAPIAALNRNCDYKDDAAGLPMPGVSIQIDQPNEDHVGEILIKGPNVMLGYYGDEAATKMAIDSNGYFHSGDLGYMDRDQFVHITGRKKNVIVTKNGKNIFPEEIEYLLLKSPYIEEVIVYGSEEDGETIVKANIFPNYDAIAKAVQDGVLLTDDVHAVVQNEIKTVNKQLVTYKAVKGFALREREFEKTSTKKIKRYVEDNQV